MKIGADHHAGGQVLQCRDGAVWVDDPCADTGPYIPADGVESVPAAAAARGVAAVRVAGLVRTPLRFDPAVTEPDRHPPSLGEHTREVLSEFGFSESEVASLC